MAPRSEDETLTEAELDELKRNLLLFSGPHVQNFYRDAHKACSLDRKPNPKAMQQLVTAWKVLHGWDGNEKRFRWAPSMEYYSDPPWQTPNMSRS